MEIHIANGDEGDGPGSMEGTAIFALRGLVGHVSNSMDQLEAELHERIEPQARDNTVARVDSAEDHGSSREGPQNSR